jgi:flagellar hook assembly protein FlgD
MADGGLRTTLITWEGTDNNGQKVPAGVYFVRLESGDDKEVKKVILLR